MIIANAGEHAVSFDVALKRARADFLEMPGLCITPAQASRLWGLDGGVCAAVLSELVDTRFLTRTSRNTFVRAGR
jgi:hypothetical protein